MRCLLLLLTAGTGGVRRCLVLDMRRLTHVVRLRLGRRLVVLVSAALEGRRSELRVLLIELEHLAFLFVERECVRVGGGGVWGRWLVRRSGGCPVWMRAI